MTFATGHVEQATMTSAALASTFSETRPLIVPVRAWRAAVVVGEVFAAVGVVLCVPIVILAMGIPIVLCVRLLLWTVGML